MPYKPGDWKMICDRTGGQYYASEMRFEERTGLWVHKDFYDPEHPQEHIESIPDDQSVPVARPDTIASMGETTLASSASAWATSLTLTSASGLEQYDPIAIVLNDSTTHHTFITADPATGVVTLNDGIYKAADSGNVVYLPSINNYQEKEMFLKKIWERWGNSHFVWTYLSFIIFILILLMLDQYLLGNNIGG